MLMIGLQLGSVVALMGLSGEIAPNAAVWTTALTVGGSVILQILKDRREAARHNEEHEDRLEVARLQAEATSMILAQGIETRKQLVEKGQEAAAALPDPVIPTRAL